MKVVTTVFQFLIGTIQMTRQQRRIARDKKVSIPHRYDTNTWPFLPKRRHSHLVSIPHRYDTNLTDRPNTRTVDFVSIPHRYDTNSAIL